MGNKIVTFTEQQLEDYQDCTFFTRKEILSRKVAMFHYINDKSLRLSENLALYEWWHSYIRENFSDVLVGGRESEKRLQALGRGMIDASVFKRFREMSPDKVPKSMTEDQASRIQVPLAFMEKLPELKENPFRRRICEVFSRDGSGNMTFEDFLDLMSIFSEQAPRDLKVYYAFRIYDFDGDKFISTADLGVALRLLTRSELSTEELLQIAEKVVEEADVDGDGKLSFMEFEHVITRAPDFLSTFHIRI